MTGSKDEYSHVDNYEPEFSIITRKGIKLPVSKEVYEEIKSNVDFNIIKKIDVQTRDTDRIELLKIGLFCTIEVMGVLDELAYTGSTSPEELRLWFLGELDRCGEIPCVKPISDRFW
jgi:hypothetical protein